MCSVCVHILGSACYCVLTSLCLKLRTLNVIVTTKCLHEYFVVHLLPVYNSYLFPRDTLCFILSNVIICMIFLKCNKVQ